MEQYVTSTEKSTYRQEKSEKCACTRASSKVNSSVELVSQQSNSSTTIVTIATSAAISGQITNTPAARK